MSHDSQVAIAPLQHGYHRLTGFSGRFRSPTNPIRWCDSSSLATPSSAGGTMGAGHFRQPVLMAVTEENHTTGLRPWEMHPFWCWRTTSPKGKHVTGFSGRFAPLRIQFLCHPGGGSFSGDMLCSAYEVIAFLRFYSATRRWQANEICREPLGD